MKAELMLVGFLSLLLTVLQDPISKICISAHAGSIMLPCKLPAKDYVGSGDKGGRRRRLLSWLQGETHRRFLAAPAGEDVCEKKVTVKPPAGRDHLSFFLLLITRLQWFFGGSAGPGGAHVRGQHAPAAHLHLRARRLPCRVQRHHHSSKPSQSELSSQLTACPSVFLSVRRTISVQVSVLNKTVDSRR